MIEPVLRKSVKPRCPVFGECGGCQYQDMPYEEELAIKENQIQDLLISRLGLARARCSPIVPSPQEYHYRNRLDLKLSRVQQQGVAMGFSPVGHNRMVPVSACSIARPEISDYLPQLFQEAQAKFSSDYNEANLVVRSGEETRVRWGGIGRRSLQMEAKDFFWTEIRGQRIFYSLGTFFQTNLSILPTVIERIRFLDVWSKETLFLDLYSGVGLFGILLADLVAAVVMVEESATSVRLARYNLQHHGLPNATIKKGRIEDELPGLLVEALLRQKVALVDPPRAGLSPKALTILKDANFISALIYLSCQPDSLVRDLGILTKTHWQIENVVPFDFFPKTKHIETLVLLKPQNA